MTFKRTALIISASDHTMKWFSTADSESKSLHCIQHTISSTSQFKMYTWKYIVQKGKLTEINPIPRL